MVIECGTNNTQVQWIHTCISTWHNLGSVLLSRRTFIQSYTIRWLKTMLVILKLDLFLLVSDKKSEKKLLKFRHEIDGTLTRIGGPNFSDILVKELHGNLPGDYHKPRPLPPKLLRTSVNARAREGYMYWYMEKPPPKSEWFSYFWLVLVVL